MEDKQQVKPKGILESLKLSLEQVLQIVTLVGSIVAVVMSIGTKETSEKNEGELVEHRIAIEKLQTLMDVADSVEADFKISSPSADARLSIGTVKIEGTWSGNLSTVQQNGIWVFAQQGNLFYPPSDKVTLSADGTWSTDVYLGIAGNFKIIVLLADQRDSAWLRKWVLDTQKRALNGLPEHVLVLKTVDITIM